MGFFDHVAGAASGASNAIEEMVARQFQQLLARQQMEQAQQRIDLEGARVNETIRQNDAVNKRNAAADEEKKTVAGSRKRGLSNMAGVIGMGLDPETAKREIAMSALNADVDVPQGVMDAVTPPPAPRRTVVTTIGPKGAPIKKAVTDEELATGVPEYREPKTATGPQGSMQWVVGPDGQEHYRVPQRGDKRPPTVGDRDKPTSAAPSEFTLEHSRDVVRKVDEILPRIGMLTAGPIGSVLSNVGGTEAADVGADLQSLAANIAFQQLQKMREASKTGGALGNVAAQEMELLKNVEASIQQNQSPANLRKNLTVVRDSAARFLAASEKSGGLEPMRPQASHAGAAPAGGGAVKYRFNPQTGKVEPVQ